jgi:hypothetical protein
LEKNTVALIEGTSMAALKVFEEINENNVDLEFSYTIVKNDCGKML